MPSSYVAAERPASSYPGPFLRRRRAPRVRRAPMIQQEAAELPVQPSIARRSDDWLERHRMGVHLPQQPLSVDLLYGAGETSGETHDIGCHQRVHVNALKRKIRGVNVNIRRDREGRCQPDPVVVEGTSAAWESSKASAARASLTASNSSDGTATAMRDSCSSSPA